MLDDDDDGDNQDYVDYEHYVENGENNENDDGDADGHHHHQVALIIAISHFTIPFWFSVSSSLCFLVVTRCSHEGRTT